MHVRVERAGTAFTRAMAVGQVLRLPIAHAEGNYTLDQAGLDALEARKGVLFRYCSPEGDTRLDFTPNGAANGIAGIVNERGNVLGMMPHPERVVEEVTGGIDGLWLFRSIEGMLSKV